MPRLLLSVLSILFFTQASIANHFTGAELRYEYVGSPHIYTVKLTLYKTCESGAIDFPSFISIYAESKQLGQRINKNLPRNTNDTLQTYCPATITSCTNLSSDYPGYLVAEYSDTIKMPPGGIDWMFVFSNSTRNFGITNLLGASGQSFYIDAPIKVGNNNTSAQIPDYPPHVLFVNDSVSIPLTAIDKDGDSVAYSFIAPQSGASTSIPYSPGYSHVYPFGLTGRCYITADNNLVLKSTTSGKFTLCMKIHEYRNGTYLGYTTRDFIIICKNVPAGALTIPQPQSRKNMMTYSCPGRKNTLKFNFVDPDPTDSVYLDFELPSIPGWSFNSSVSNGIGSATGTITWTTPLSVNPATMPFIDFSANVTDNACQRVGKATYVYKVMHRDCNIDSVWPGDANYDKLADIYDVLAVAMAYKDTGSKRPNATTNWAAQFCNYWDGTFLDNIDKKHADCNGDGLVDTADLHAIRANYGLTHAKGGPQKKTTAAPDLYFNHTGIKANPDSIVSIKMLLGSSSTPVNDIYGLAANVSVAGLILATPPVITYNTSWLGKDTTTLHFTKDISPISLDWAYARTDHKNTSGQGQVAELEFKIPASTPNGTLVTLSYSKARIIDNQGVELAAFNMIEDTFYVWHLPSSVNYIQDGISNIKLYPNPSAGDVTVNWFAHTSTDVTITVSDITGKVLSAQPAYARTGNNSITISGQDIAKGIYLVTVKTADESSITTLKWVKQ